MASARPRARPPARTVSSSETRSEKAETGAESAPAWCGAAGSDASSSPIPTVAALAPRNWSGRWTRTTRRQYGRSTAK